jgi:hypothetical protein
MTRDEFMTAIVIRRINPSAFSIDNSEKNECYVLSANIKNWSVFYIERGQNTKQIFFDSESDALQHLLMLLESDPSTRLTA